MAVGAASARFECCRLQVMPLDLQSRPKLRPVEAFAVPGDGSTTFGVRDPTGISRVGLTLSPAALHILSMMDGDHTCAQIMERFGREVGQSLHSETLSSIVANLEEARLLESASFEAFYRSLVDEYRAAAVREMPHAADLGITGSDGSIFEEMLAGVVPFEGPGDVVGLIVPHLDYARGRPCYAKGYSSLRGMEPPRRVVLLGTNHFGRATSVVATGNAFRTPLGLTAVDTAFLEKLEDRCGHLREHELDHAREHSIELQVAWLQHLFGAESFAIVPFLCTDPCGPTGTASYDGGGVDLRDFAVALREAIAADGDGTLVVAGADLSHVGSSFGDDRGLDDEFLSSVRRLDEQALTELQAAGADGLVKCLRAHDNSTRVCSAGCMFVLATVLADARASVLDYHQAVDRVSGTCVSCAAVLYTR